MLRHLFLAVSLCLFGLGFSQNTSTIDFVIKNLGINVDGHFKTFSINAKMFSDGTLEAISSNINVSSITTGIESRDEHILEEDYFDAPNYPYITLETLSVDQKTANRYELTANLKIKAKSKTIKIPVAVEKMKGQYKITSNFEINRRDFDVGGGSFVMGKTVKINVIHYQSLND